MSGEVHTNSEPVLPHYSICDIGQCILTDGHCKITDFVIKIILIYLYFENRLEWIGISTNFALPVQNQ